MNSKNENVGENKFTKMTYEQCIVSYMPLMKKLSYLYKNKFPDIPLEREDYINLMLWRMKHLVENYDERYGKRFPIYIKENLMFFLNNETRKMLTKNQQILNRYVSYEPWMEGDKTRSIVEEPRLSESQLSILTSREKQVLKLFLNGYTQEEVEKKLSWDKRTVYSTKARALRKLRKHKNQTI
ncbi:MAG: hypothetical protein HRS57_00205 [Mycoplasmataceae bacterium]|nr:hypothetical protein [Mycoplasmataceae bacterium]